MKKPNTSKILILALGMLCTAPMMTSCRHRDRDTTEEAADAKANEKKLAKPFFYIERSGSMTSYDSEQGDGSFKASIVDMMNNVPGMDSRNAIFIVNDGIYPYPKGKSQFVEDNNIFASTKSIGDPSYTDFNKIFKTLADKSTDSRLNILVSDLIYSVKTNEENNSQKIFNSEKSMVSSIFSGANNLAVIVVQMKGSYNGPYYAFNSPNKGQQYDGPRPYYIVAMASNETLNSMLANEKYNTFLNFQHLNGFQHIALFSKGADLKPYYSFLLNGKENEGRIKARRGQGAQITEIDNVKPGRGTDKVVMTMAVNLSGMPIEKAYLEEKTNYEVSSDCGLKLKAIRPLTSADNTPANRKHIGTATHIFVLEADHVGGKNECVIRLKKQFPSWITESSTDNDTNLSSVKFSKTTFGLKYLLGGIWESLASDCYFEMPILIED